MMAIILLATVIIIFWSLKSPFVGLLGVLMLNILRPGEIYSEFAALRLERVTAIVVLLSTLAHERRFATPKITKRVLFFWGTMFVSIPFSFWVGNSLDFTIQFGTVVAYHLLIVTLVDTEARFRIFLITFSVLIGWIAASSFYLYIAGSYMQSMGVTRAVGLTSAGDSPNTLANTLVSGLPLMALLLTDTSKKVRLFALATGFICIFTVVTTGSRMGFFSMLFLFGIFVATRQKKFIYIPALIILLAVAWTFIPDQYKERYETVNNLEQDQSYQNRIRAWKAGWAMFLANPVTGQGAGNFTYAAGSEFWPGPGRKIWLNAHNLLLKALGDLGLLGTIAFAMMVVTLFKVNAELRRKAANADVPRMLKLFPLACNFSLAVLLFAGYTNHNLYRNTWFMLGAMSGAMQLMLERKEKTAEQAAAVEPEPLTDDPPGMKAYS